MKRLHYQRRESVAKKQPTPVRDVAPEVPDEPPRAGGTIAMARAAQLLARLEAELTRVDDALDQALSGAQ